MTHEHAEEGSAYWLVTEDEEYTITLFKGFEDADILLVGLYNTSEAIAQAFKDFKSDQFIMKNNEKNINLILDRQYRINSKLLEKKCKFIRINILGFDTSQETSHIAKKFKIIKINLNKSYSITDIKDKCLKNMDTKYQKNISKERAQRIDAFIKKLHANNLTLDKVMMLEKFIAQ